MGVAVSNSSRSVRSPFTKLWATVRAFFKLWASSTMTRSQRRFASRRATRSCLARVRERSSRGLRQGRSLSWVSTSMANFSAISPFHCSRSELGTRMSTFSMTLRESSSRTTNPASMVLPNPTSSARMARPCIGPRTLCAVRTW